MDLSNLGTWEWFWIAIVASTVVGGLWRPFRAAALLMEAKARHWNALAAIEEKKAQKTQYL